MITVRTGLDQLVDDGFAALRGRSIGVLCNQATVDHRLRHIIDLMLPLHHEGLFRLAAVFGPQHGPFGHTQDNMIEWEGKADSRTELPFHSLYGAHREPTDEMLNGIDFMVIDLPDIGSRYYTFAWTMAMCLAACERRRIPVLVLDRPNPIGGLQIEGPVLHPAFSSFVGLHPVPVRHGLTLGEIATFVRQREFPDAEMKVARVAGWSRDEYLDETNLPWVLPSPNMATLDTAIVYPGGCLLEATNLSEGRGTTHPFEMFGAPFLDGWKLADALRIHGLPGVAFRPIQFEPTSNKHVGKLCCGCFVHVTDRRSFEPVLTYVAILREVIRQVGLGNASRFPIQETFRPDAPEIELDRFVWRNPPYEYEAVRRPIDILAGNDWLASETERDTPLNELRDRFAADAERFNPARSAALLYR